MKARHRSAERASGRLWIALLLPFVLALTVYGRQAWHSPLFDPQRTETDRYLAEIMAMPRTGDPLDAAIATAYWARYPDVASDAYYGPDGPLGEFGAIQHYRDHGHHEGRQWQ